jgi:drug/metabolite transporter (DMT)-like permease
MPGLRNAWRAAAFADVILVSCSLVWGVNISVSALILRHLQRVTFAAVSCGIAALAFGFITLTREGSLRIPRRDIGHVLLPGALTIVAFILLFQRIENRRRGADGAAVRHHAAIRHAARVSCRT